MTGSGDRPRKTISKVLVANRGEIAVRILRTLRVMGIPGVIVYHEAESGSRARHEADEAWEITGDTPVAAYLDGAQIVAACRSVGADAVHPGYGFLSENAEFARQVSAAGLTFVGPEPDVIDLMGDKIASRTLVAEHGFPVAPSVSEADEPKGFAANAAAMGFPLVVKAAAGGGGKGMYVVHDAESLADQIVVARREAERYFGDGRLYCERYIERPRHIEVQVLADRSGNVIDLGERECSVQRRFQKIIEESPAPGLAPKLRKDIRAAAVGIASAAGYTNAGTVEFLLAPDGAFYFLEMNTRLQVEHPVTEMVTGVDLVGEQIRIASGEDLRLKQAQVQLSGHAIECRIYAEDPEQDFMPTTGKALLVREPAGPGIRCDSGLRSGQAVTAAFDPMLAKIVAHGVDRGEAIARLRAALRETVVLGVSTNTDWLERALADADFEAGTLDTGFVDRRRLSAGPSGPEDEVRDVILAAAALGISLMPGAAPPPPEPHGSIGAWRN